MLFRHRLVKLITSHCKVYDLFTNQNEIALSDILLTHDIETHRRYRIDSKFVALTFAMEEKSLTSLYPLVDLGEKNLNREFAKRKERFFQRHVTRLCSHLFVVLFIRTNRQVFDSLLWLSIANEPH